MKKTKPNILYVLLTIIYSIPLFSRLVFQLWQDYYLWYYSDNLTMMFRVQDTMDFLRSAISASRTFRNIFQVIFTAILVFLLMNCIENGSRKLEKTLIYTTIPHLLCAITLFILILLYRIYIYENNGINMYFYIYCIQEFICIIRNAILYFLSRRFVKPRNF